MRGPKSRLAGRRREKISTCALQTWQRPTLPRLETKYHQRWGVSRPSSEWDRVQPPRQNHQVSEKVKDDFWSLFSRPSGERLPPSGRRPVPASGPALAPPSRSGRRFRAEQPREGVDEHCIMRAFKPIELLVPVSCTPCGASTPGLSTWWSSTALEGELVSRWVSRLDAFSGYPVRT